MARQEQDREDLFAEAIACRERAEVQLQGGQEPVLLGWREDGRFDCFFGGDPVYHFNAQGELRRAFVNGKLYRTQGETLAELTRERQAEQSLLLRHDLTAEACNRFCEHMQAQLRSLADALASGNFEVLRTTLPDDQFQQQGVAACQRVLSAVRCLAPRFPGKR